jgi:hypothetical protein
LVAEEDAVRREALRETAADFIATSLRDAADLVISGARGSPEPHAEAMADAVVQQRHA